MSKVPAPENNFSDSNPHSFTTKPYPKADADFQKIAQNTDLFWEKVQSFHAYFGTKLKVPTLGGNTIDLHHLFVEVTSRGGIEKVLKDRKWKEVTAAFRFPSSITSASFALRKCYLSLLYHFEQVYYFRSEKPPSFVADSTNGTVNGSEIQQASADGVVMKQHSESPGLEDGSSVTGTIDAKFDYGYLVTVDLGSEKLKGVLYHTPTAPNMSQALISTSSTKGRKKRRQLDPSRPKPNRSGYTFFFAEHYASLKPSYHGQEKTISKKIGALWNRLSEAEKQVYQEKGLRDKERYRTEMSKYRSSHHLQAQ